MQFPVTVTFRLLALAHQIRVLDASGVEYGYLEAQPADYAKGITVYSDASRSTAIYHIHFQDLSRHIRFGSADGGELGFASRVAGGYDIGVGEQVVFEVRHGSTAVDLADILLNFPILRFIAGYTLQPRLLVTRPGGAVVSMVAKRPIIFGTSYVAALSEPVSGDEQAALVLSMIFISVTDRHQRRWLGSS